MGADSAILIDGILAPEFDTRLNVAFSEVYEPMDLDDDLSESPVMSQLTPDLVIRMFPAAPRANIEKYLPLVRRALIERGLVDKAMILMALATMRAECATFDPISEVPSPLNTESHGPPFNKYDWRQDLGNMGPPDGAKFKGRGFIQLTGRKNYKLYGALLGYDLIGNPELANTPQPAAQILAAYLKQNEPSIRMLLAAGDLAAARRIVNGGLNGLDGFRAAYLVGDLLIRDYESDIALSRGSHGSRESRKIKAVKAASISSSASKSVKSIEKKKDDDDDRKTRAKKKDDAANGRVRAKKKDDVADRKVKAKKKDDVADRKVKAKKKDDVADRKVKAKKKDDAADGKVKKKKYGETDEDNNTNGKKKGKGFFLFRPFRVFRAVASSR
jgi:peptidoglycan L-alanyl-D-glutamate endopeptidase CwlK